MGKISELQNHQEDLKIGYIKREYQRQGQRKIASRASQKSTRYTMNPNKNKQLSNGKRTIAGIAVALGIVASIGGVSHINQNSPTQVEAFQETDGLSKEDVIQNAENLITNWIGESGNLKFHYDYYVNNRVLSIGKVIPNTAEYTEVQAFEYMPDAKEKVAAEQNNQIPPEMKKFLDLLLEVQHVENPSQEQLEALNTMANEINIVDFDKAGKNIADSNQQNQEER